MQHITLSEVRAAALKAYNSKLLLAQSSEIESYGYSVDCSDGVTRVCAIGAALNSETLERIREENLSNDTLQGSADLLLRVFTWDKVEYPALIDIQRAHDNWGNGIQDRVQDITLARREAEFLNLIS